SKVRIADQFGNQVTLGSLFGNNGSFSRRNAGGSGRFGGSTFRETMTIRMTQNSRLASIVQALQSQNSGRTAADFTSGSTTPPIKAGVTAPAKIEISEKVTQRTIGPNVPGISGLMKGIPSDIRLGQFSGTVLEKLTVKTNINGLRIDNTAAVNQDKGMRDLTSAANFKYGFTQKVNARFNAGQSGGALRRLSVSRKPAPKPDTLHKSSSTKLGRARTKNTQETLTR
ncbi:hypothetical protein PSTT_07386, partial [Puccinia striiformis]